VGVDPRKLSTQMARGSTALPGVIVVEPQVHRDQRGFFLETYHRRRYADLGITVDFVQHNHSQSRKGVLRGLHYQDLSAPMAKLVRCAAGAILDVAVDLRLGSPTFSQWYALELTADNARQLFIPVGFGHAFLALSDVADVDYKCSGYYDRAAECVIAWDDPDIGIAWPEKQPILAERDTRGMSLSDYRKRPAFVYD
jgi:dTDP-4-dehydrorhamnose 3,5-epimerase